MLNTVAHITQFGRCLGAAIPALRRFRLLVPFAALGAIELILLGLYLGFTLPLLSSLAAPLVGFFFGESALHYPQHVWMLPGVVDWIRCAVSVSAGPALYAVAARRLYAGFSGAPAPQARPGAAAALAGAVALYALLDVGLQRGVGLLADVRIVGRFQPLWVAVVYLAHPVLIVALAHTVYGIAVAGRRGPAALRSGLVVTHRTLAITAMLAAGATVLLVPTELVLDRAAWFVDNSRPEAAGMAAAVAVVWEVLVRAALFFCAVWLRIPKGGR